MWHIGCLQSVTIFQLHYFFTFNIGCYLNLSYLYLSLDYMIILVVHTRWCSKSLARLSKEVMDIICCEGCVVMPLFFCFFWRMREVMKQYFTNTALCACVYSKLCMQPHSCHSYPYPLKKKMNQCICCGWIRLCRWGTGLEASFLQQHVALQDPY